MAFTMHSHSGQFCPGHAKDQLEDIIVHAISIGYKTMALTEHMPRMEVEDLYPEELLTRTHRPLLQLGADPATALAVLGPRHESYIEEAQRLQAKYAGRIHLLIGFEGEWYRPSYGPYITTLAAHPAVDYFIGSIHHVNGIPIDYDKAMYQKARESCPGSNEEALYERYYDQQHELLSTLRPRIVGHFDLIRLLSEEPARDVRKLWPGVWQRILRNLRVARELGAWLECNTSALRKGLAEPYPCRDIAVEWLTLGGKFTFSDDSHGIAQVATNYHRGVDFLESLGVTEVWTYTRTPAVTTEAPVKARLEERAVTLAAFRDIKS